ncbi:M23 family metallopeptidase [Undibacterium sp. Dicai25W]|uniref:M23 family metallopeptidase n=1 Tax=Undibacterium sp. Dicai25W TaxID=3413034 RepID=UPI003BF21D24
MKIRKPGRLFCIFKMLECVFLSCILMPQISGAETPLINVETVKVANADTVIAKNLSQIPITVTLTLTSANNIVSSTSWPITRLIPAGETLELVKVSAADTQQVYSFYFKYEYLIGQPNAQAKTSAIYMLPFRSDRIFQVSQASDGPIFSHHDFASKYAIDILMPIGTTVVAARDGIVIENVNQFPDNGKAEPEYKDKANYIRILHDDGTWSLYLHLQRFSSQVAVGQKVTAGTAIASSGNSGFSTEPHLHFALQKNEDGSIVSFPIQFKNAKSNTITPTYHTWLSTGVNDANFVPSSKAKRSVKKCSQDGVIDDAALQCMKGY